MSLYKHQIDFLSKNPNKSVLVWSCGTSKTRTALEWSKLYSGKTLAITLKGLVNNWKREMDKWNIHVDVISKENFRRDHQTLPRYDQIIIDEIHAGWLTPHFKSQMSKSMRWYLKKHNISRFLGLSATVYTSSPWNIFNLAYYVGYKLDWKKFDWEYFDHIRMGMRIIPVAKKGSEKKLAELTKKFASVVDIADVIDVPLQQHCEPEYFALTKEQEKAIKENYDPLPIVRYTVQHEIENGIVTAHEFRESRWFDTDKADRIEALVEENPKIAIVCRYNDQINALAHRLARFKPMIIRGDVKDRDKVCQEAENAPRAVVLIQADCGIGFELPSFGVCVYASMSYSYTSFEQMNGRFLRMNKPSRTTFIYLLTEGDSVDQGIYDAIKIKEDFRIELYKK